MSHLVMERRLPSGMRRLPPGRSDHRPCGCVPPSRRPGQALLSADAPARAAPPLRARARARAARRGALRGFGWRPPGDPASQDFTVSGGSAGEVHSIKVAEIMAQSFKTGLPFIFVNDSGGARVQEGIDSLSGYGKVFYTNVMLSGVLRSS